MSEISREDLKQHCIRTIENCEKWCKYKGTNPMDDKSYQEHKMTLDMIEKLEKIEKTFDTSCLSDDTYSCKYDGDCFRHQIEVIEQIVKEVE